MSDLLKKAIADAQVLKEAALTSAKNLVFEEYSDQIKEAVTTILEADEFGEDNENEDPELDMGMGMGDEELGGQEELTSHPEVTPAAVDGEVACPCADPGDEIELDFADLQASLAAQDGDEDEFDTEEHEDAAEDVLGLQEKKGLAAPDFETEVEIDEEIDIQLTEDDIETLAEIDLDEDEESVNEEVTVDHSPVPTGKSGFHGRTEGEAAEESMKELTVAQHDEETKELKKEMESLKESQTTLKAENREMKRLLNSTGNKLQESNLRNARLLYTNKVLINPSLNERQKKKFVEAIGKASSVEQVKITYETLKESLDFVAKKRDFRGSKALNEAITRDRVMTAVRQRSGDPISESQNSEEKAFWDKQKKLAKLN